MQPAAYDAWYRSARGRWIGASEVRLLQQSLRMRPAASVLDVGCGSGYFSRRLCEAGMSVTGIDSDFQMVRYAVARPFRDERYLVGDACTLPFRDQQFSYAVAMTSFCFIRDQVAALRELARVSKCGVALGLLNRRSLLSLRKGRRGGAGAYEGAHWHTAGEVRALFGAADVRLAALRSAIHLPGGGQAAQWLEQWLSPRTLTGAFLLAVGTPAHARRRNSRHGA